MKEGLSENGQTEEKHWGDLVRERLIDELRLADMREKFMDAQTKHNTKMRFTLDFDETIARLLSGQPTEAIAEAGTITPRAFRELYIRYFKEVFLGSPDFRTLQATINSIIAEAEYVPDERKRMLMKVAEQAQFHGCELRVAELDDPSKKSSACSLNGKPGLIAIARIAQKDKKGNGQEYFRFEFSHTDVQSTDWLVLAIENADLQKTYVVPSNYLAERVELKTGEEADYSRCFINVPLRPSDHPRGKGRLSVEQFEDAWPT